MKAFRSLVILAIVVSILAPAAMADGRKPGSVLIFPVHRSGTGSFTVVCVTNINTTPQTPANFGGSTSIHYEYVNATTNPANPFCPLACVVFDRIEFLTPADTLCVLTGCHNATAAGASQGYLVVSAQNPAQFNVPWAWNFLIGSELVMNASGATYSVNAIPFRSGLGQGANTDVAPANGQLDFNGVEYEAIADLLYIDSFVALGGSQLALINLTGGRTDLNTILMSIWNDNEFPLSTTLEFKCWFDQPLTAISPLFTENFLGSLPNDPQELDIDCDGVSDMETGWAIIESIQVRTAGGVPFSPDGALLGCITAGPQSSIDGGHLLWESVQTQNNGSFTRP